ncbi:MAG TPA: dihydrodipicolinate synthase family protein [Acidobacteriota bacterium]|nr:dihydrodipicolinate synthase family protein [Acidobacteriota bacterium]
MPRNFRTGLIVPAVTALDQRGELILEDQRRLLRHCLRNGASVIFSPGTTGEFLHLRNDQRLRLMEVSVEEVRALAQGEVWPVINGRTLAETLSNLEAAAYIGAHRFVVAPLAISDLSVDDVVPFVRDLSLKARTGTICLYENPDISAHPDLRLLPLETLRLLLEIPEIVGIKISAPSEVVFPIHAMVQKLARPTPVEVYLGYALQIFSIDLPESAVGGIVSGTGNLLPREWSDAWKACMNESPLAEDYQAALEILERAASPKFISAIKWGLHHLGIFSSVSGAVQTPALTEKEAAVFISAFEEARAMLRKKTVIRH